jgi:predicted TIM-barrel fold metal-dependent hydrolase
MKLIGLEEHFATPDLMAAWRAQDPVRQDLAVGDSIAKGSYLLDLADRRIAAMDEAGVDVEVLSMTTPGVQGLEPDRAVPLARAANELMAATVHDRPERFQGFATLPTSAPDQAARELERAVLELRLNGAMLFGRTGERNLDHPDFLPFLETAAALHAPIYLHPQSPRTEVRMNYYQGLGDGLERVFATAGVGWHYETGIQVLRLILAGVFDRLPSLQLILGHWGELVLFYLDRIDIMTAPARLPRPVSSYFRTNVSVTPSGIFSDRYLRWACEVVGVDRILFSTDYPFHMSKSGGARRFLENAQLCVSDREKIASGNWYRLIGDIRR